MKENFPIVYYRHEAFQEYKDEVSLVLWCFNCNWNCSWCSMKGLIYDKRHITDDDYIDLIKNYTSDIETAVVFLGGEPTLYPFGLHTGCIEAKKKGLKTKIYTNGSHIYPIIDLIDTTLDGTILDAVSIDYKDRKDDLELLRELPEDFNIDIRITKHNGLTSNDIDKMIKKVDRINPNANVYVQDLIVRIEDDSI